MEISDTDPTDYLASVDDPRRGDLMAIDGILAASMPGRQRVLWEGVFWGGTEQSIIGYGDLVQPRPRGDDVEWFIIGLALQKNYISLYVNAVLDGAYLGAAYADRLAKPKANGATKGTGRVKVGSASISFPSAEALDLETLTELAAHADRLSPPDRPRPSAQRI